MPHSDKMLDEELLVRESARKAAASMSKVSRARRKAWSASKGREAPVAASMGPILSGGAENLG